MDVARIQNVMGHLSVELITVLLGHLGWDAVQGNVMVTLIAQVENAILSKITADLTQSLLIGQDVTTVHNVPMGKEIVIITMIVKEHLYVAIIIVQMDQQEWTAVQMKVILI